MENNPFLSPRNIGSAIGILCAGLSLLLPEDGLLTSQGKYALACALCMSTLWISELIPLAVTALLPLVLFPVLGIMSSKDVAPHYANNVIFLFVGGFILAAAVSHWHLHKRLALHVIKIVGTSERRLLLGFMVATAFISLWVSNTATTLMLLPIGAAVVQRISSDGEVSGFGARLMLGVAFASSIGGMGTLIGTPPNLIFSGFWREEYPQEPSISFLDWMFVGIPVAICLLVACYLVLSRGVRGANIDADTLARRVIGDELLALGSMSPGEIRVAFLFLVTIAMWIFREPVELGSIVVPGWTQLLPDLIGKEVDDMVVAIAASVALFLIPAGNGKPLLDWKAASSAIPWGTVLLFGGGFALAAAFKSSGLDRWLGQLLGNIAELPLFVSIVAIVVFVTVLSEIASNSAAITLMLPILAAVAEAKGYPSKLLLIPATLAASSGFMLPVATPPNAIAFGTGLIPIRTMVRAGLLLDLVGAMVISIVCYICIA